MKKQFWSWLPSRWFAVRQRPWDPRHVAVIDYTNWRGVRSLRKIVPIEIHWGVSIYHPAPGWILEAYDVDKDAFRTFAIEDIHSWKDGVLPEPMER